MFVLVEIPVVVIVAVVLVMSEMLEANHRQLREGDSICRCGWNVINIIEFIHNECTQYPPVMFVFGNLREKWLGICLEALFICSDPALCTTGVGGTAKPRLNFGSLPKSRIRY